MAHSNVKKLGKLPNGALDTYYIDSYLEKPANKKNAYLTALDRFERDCTDQGIESYKVNRDHAYQYAKSIHDRLRERINNELDKLAEDDKSLGRSVLRDLAVNADSESVKAQCASNLAKGLYPDVQVIKDETIEDIDQALEQNRKELEQLTGITQH